MKLTRLAALAVAMALACSRLAGASGLLLPREPELPPLAIKSHRVNVEIRDGVATSKLAEVFVNNTDRRLEATYVFPVPAGATITDFAMYINGKRQAGEVVEADKARRVYEDIVRRMRDPGLLEYMGRNMLKMRVFPIEPRSTQKIELSYSYALPFESGLYRYTFPLKTGQKASRVLDDVTFSVEITSTNALANIYSPTHKVGISREGENRAVVGFEESGGTLDRDFVLYYGLAQEDFGLNLLTYRPEGKDGYFALMIAPRLGIKDEDVLPKDVAFVLDVSGSMQQENRIGSAKKAIEFCLNALNPRDRFAVLPFSTSVEKFREGLSEASPENV